jgi:hypothetical protein
MTDVSPISQVLDLQSTRLGDHGFVALAEVLLNNSTLVELNVSHNDLTEAGAPAFFRALERSRLQVGSALQIAVSIRMHVRSLTIDHLCLCSASTCAATAWASQAPPR